MEVELALSEGSIKTHSPIRFKNPDYGTKTIYGDAGARILETTAGPRDLQPDLAEGTGFYNKVCGKKASSPTSSGVATRSPASSAP